MSSFKVTFKSFNGIFPLNSLVRTVIVAVTPLFIVIFIFVLNASFVSVNAVCTVYYSKQINTILPTCSCIFLRNLNSVFECCSMSPPAGEC